MIYGSKMKLKTNGMYNVDGTKWEILEINSLSGTMWRTGDEKMVSIRKVREIFRLRRKQIQDLATAEVQSRVDMLTSKLIELSIYNSNKRGQNSRVSVDDVKLAYMTIVEMATKEEIKENKWNNEEEFGDWNE